MRVCVGARDRDRVRVRLPPLIIITDRTTLICPHPWGLCGDTEFMRSIWQRCDALTTDGVPGSTSDACLFTIFVATLQRLVALRLYRSTSLHKCRA